MSWWPFGRKDSSTVTEHADGSRNVTTTFELSGETRPVREDVVAMVDESLERLGGEVMHALDPKRILRYESGGPAIWSVGLVEVPGKRPYTLLLSYGLSCVISPEESRKGIHHEYSLAIPAGTPVQPWADALLRHLSRYVLSSGKDLRPGEIMPCHAPITCLAFQPEHHKKMPRTSLVGIVVASDPTIDTIETPYGEITVRRILGIDQDELDRVETWSPQGFVEEYKKSDPLLLTDLTRPSRMADVTFRKTVAARASAEGSSVPAILLDVSWEDTGDELVIEFPGEQQAQKLLDALRGRLPFGEKLLVISPDGPPIGFAPAKEFDINWSDRGLFIDGNLDEPNFSRIVDFIRPDAGGATVRLPLKR
jgi:hypothetical protein